MFQWWGGVATRHITMDYFLELTACLSVGAGLLTYHLIPRFREMFIKANLYGVDLNKAGVYRLHKKS